MKEAPQDKDCAAVRTNMQRFHSNHPSEWLVTNLNEPNPLVQSPTAVACYAIVTLNTTASVYSATDTSRTQWMAKLMLQKQQNYMAPHTSPASLEGQPPLNVWRLLLAPGHVELPRGMKATSKPKPRWTPSSEIGLATCP